MYKMFTLATAMLVLTGLFVGLPVTAQLPPLQYPATIPLTAAEAGGPVSGQFVITAGDAAVSNISFAPDALTDADGNVAVAAGAVTVTPSRIEELAASASATVTVSIEQAPGPGMYEGRIAITYEGQPDGTTDAVLLTLTIEEEEPPAEEPPAEEPPEEEPPAEIEGEEPVPEEPAGEPTAISLGYEPGSSVSTVEVLLENAATQARVPLFVSYSGEAQLTGVQFFASLRDAEDHPITVGTLQFVDPSQSDAPLSRIDLDAKGGARQIALRITDFSVFGTFEGFIAVEIDGDATRTAGLRVERPSQPVLSIPEAGEGNEISLTTFGSQLNDSFFLQETGGETGSQTLALSVSQLRMADGASADVTMQPDTLTLEPYIAERIVVTGEIPAVGQFRGLLTLTYGDQQQTYTLIVERNSGREQVDLGAISPPAVIRPWPWSHVSARVLLNLSETGASRASVHLPQLTQLIQAGAGADRPAANYGGWELRDPEGTPISLEGADGQATIALGPADSVQMTLAVQDIVRSPIDPGQYEGTVKVTTPSGLSFTDTFTLFVKDNWFFPALVMLLGAVASYGLRYWLAIGRPNAVEELRIARSLDTIRQAIPDATDPIRIALEQELESLLQRNRLEPSTDVPAEVAVVETMLNNYVVVREVLDLREKLEQLLPDANERKKIQEQMDALAADLRRQGLRGLKNDDQGANALVQQAEQIRQAIDAQAKKGAQEAIAELEKRVKADEAALAKSTLPESDRQELTKTLQEIKKQIEAARGEADAQKARAAYEKIRPLYQAWTIDHFRQTLTAQMAPPLGFEQAAWDTLRDELLAKLPEDATDEAYQAARKGYLKAVLEKLQGEAQKKADGLKAVVDPDQKKLAGELETLVGDAQRALGLVEKDPDQAQAQYASLLERYNALKAKLAQAGVTMGVGEAAPAAMLVGGTAPGVAEGEGVRWSQHRFAIRPPRVIRRIDILVMVLFSALTAFIGLQTLWVTNSGFGSLVDYIGALLWGFGLNELNQVALPSTVSQLHMPWYPKTQQPGSQGAGQNPNE
ncbi:MAG: hypothetical protein SXV54_20280 [Chloroflexota bacterium]|nr:hypothetical protein [Chloroflexota bacterium]